MLYSQGKIVIEMNSWANFNVSANLAMQHGGGLYMTMSEMKVKGSNLYITKNQANSKGGGTNK